MGKWIICCGMRRSASTLQYNIVKKIIELKVTGIAIGYFEYDEIYNELSKYSDHNFVLAKTHDFFSEAKKLNEEGKLKIIFSYRDIRDIVVSSMHKWFNGNFKNTYNESYICKLKKSYNDWSELSNIYLNSYENIINNLEDEVSGISKYLNIEMNDKEIQKIASELTLDKQKNKLNHLNFKKYGVKNVSGTYDPESQLHSNHIRSGRTEQWKNELKNYEIAIIQKEWRDWLISNNYQVHSTIYNYPLILNLILFYVNKKNTVWRKFNTLIKKSRVFKLPKIST